jgi:CRP-like cAMP-binding protein
LIVVSLDPGEVFWGLAFFIEEAFMPVGLVADQDSIIHSWSREGLLPYLTRNGGMSWELNKLMIRRMIYASNILEEIVFQPVTGRLARLLLDNYGDSAGDTIAREWTLDEMAARIGTKREIVCRQLSRFAEEGAIQINRTEFKITDQGLLEDFARKVKG